MYSSLLDGQRVLVILDNAASSAQVRPLLPGNSGCAVVVTSRNSLPGLGARNGAVRLRLQPLPEAEAIELLRAVLGPERADAEPVALRQIAAQCSCLPLALRIAAERATARPRQTLSSLAAELSATGRRLDVLTAEDDPGSSVRTVFSWSYQALPPQSARMFRLIGLHAGPDISVAAAAALASCAPAEAQQLMETLAGAHLIEEGTPGRYRFHDLLRVYASEVVQAGDATEASGALRRYLLWYLHSGWAACTRMEPRRPLPLEPAPPGCAPMTFVRYEQALAWLDAEYSNLIAAIGHAYETGEDAVCWQLAVALWAFFDLRRYWTDLVSCMRTAIASAHRCGASIGEARAEGGLGQGYSMLRRFEEAVGCYERAVRAHRQADDQAGEGLALNNLGCTYQRMGRYEEAAHCITASLSIARETQNVSSESIDLHNLGEISQLQHRPEEAIGYYTQSLVIARKIGYLRLDATTLYDMAVSCKTLGRLAEAAECYQESVTASRQAGDRHAEAEAHRDLGGVLYDMGQLEGARMSWRQALTIFDELHDDQAAAVRACLLRSAEAHGRLSGGTASAQWRRGGV